MAGTSSQMSSDLMNALLKDPVKRALVLQLINQEKNNIEKYKKELKEKTPLKKVKKLHCESPTALQRRRALELRNQDTSESSSSSELSEIATELKGPKLPFEELLKGVTAYVEVRRDNEDKSEGIKAVMRLMGATIRDKFTNDVTHVIFKDGSFTTFEKAKLMKIHLVSVLWLDAVRRNNARVPEKNYPAFGHRVCDANVSILCSQIQKDYQEVIKDERRRRHTMKASRTSISSYLTAQNPPHSDDEPGTPRSDSKSPELTSDDSDCGVIDGHTSKRPKELDLIEETLLTDDASTKSSNQSASLLSRVTMRNKRKTIHVLSDMKLTPTVGGTPRETKIDENKTKKVLQNSSVQSTMSSLRVSTETDRTKSGLGTSKGSEGSEIRKDVGNKENCSVTTTMSSLRLSEESGKGKKSGSGKSGRNSSVGSTNSNEKSLNSRSRRTTFGSSDESRKSSLINKLISSIVSDDSVRTSRSEDGSKNDETSDSEESEKKTESPKRKPKESPLQSGKKVRRKLLDSPESKKEQTPAKKIEVTRRNRRATSVLPRPENEIETSKVEIVKNHRRASSVAPSVSDRSSRSRRASIARTVSDSESKESEVPKNGRKMRKSISVDKIPPAETPKKKKQNEAPNPSPPKKSRVETVKKTRKLYNPNDLTAFSDMEEEKEREAYLKQKSQKSPDEVFLNPNNLKIPPPPKPVSQDSSLHLSDFSSDETEDRELKKKPKKVSKKKNKTPPKRDSSADEQKELLALLEKSDQGRRRQSQRICLSQTKPKYTFSSDSTSSTSSHLPITPLKRRSTLDFMSVSQSTQKRRLKLDPKRASSVVCTKMHRHEVANFEKIVANLGRFFVEDKVTGKTTHLVAGEAKRTLNMLRAIARGCWILKREWLEKSQEAGRWLSEEDYELTEFSPAVQQCRMEKEAFGPLYSMDIFKDCGYIYVAKKTNPKTSDLKELISICKGRVTNVYRNADIVIGELIEREGLTCVTEMWVLDSVLVNKLQPVKKYLLKATPGNDSPHF